MAHPQTTCVDLFIWLCDHTFVLTGEVAVTHDGDAGEDESREYPCLVRVTNGKETGFSTRVSVHQPSHLSIPYEPQLHRRLSLANSTPSTPHTALS